MKVETFDVVINLAIFDDDFDVKVMIQTVGDYRPATHYEPAESPDVEILHVKLLGNDILPDLSSASCEEELALCADEMERARDA